MTMINLRGYIQRRTGVPLGHPQSLSLMLSRSFGAGDYAEFWRYWNPIWSYYLSRYIHRPLSKILPGPMAVLGTFATSGFLHDLAVLVISGDWQYLCSAWFFFMGLLLVISEAVGIRYSGLPFLGRAILNAIPTLLALGTALLLIR